MEAEQYKTQVKTKTQELEHTNAQLRNKESSVQQNIAKYKATNFLIYYLLPL